MPPQALNSDLVHLGYRLYGSVPSSFISTLTTNHEADLDRLNQRRKLALTHPDYLNGIEFHTLKTELQLRAYVRFDDLLDKAKDGPMFLSSPKAKQIIIDSWHFLAKHYNLVVYVVCVMSNHVHVILRAAEDEAVIDLGKMMEEHKRFTGRELNKLQNTTGRRVWARINFDRDIRTGRFEAVLWYVINNPKKAGITKDVLRWGGTWINPLLEEEYIRPYRCVA